MTVRELLARTDSRELAEWAIYYDLNPWGPERADQRAGTIAAVMANCHSADRTFRPSDFMPDYQSLQREELSEDALMLAVMKTNALLGGSVE